MERALIFTRFGNQGLRIIEVTETALSRCVEMLEMHKATLWRTVC